MTHLKGVAASIQQDDTQGHQIFGFSTEGRNSDFYVKFNVLNFDNYSKFKNTL
jgi:hypothetical protein